jgi:hypothetical protein
VTSYTNPLHGKIIDRRLEHAHITQFSIHDIVKIEKFKSIIDFIEKDTISHHHHHIRTLENNSMATVERTKQNSEETIERTDTNERLKSCNGQNIELAIAHFPQHTITLQHSHMSSTQHTHIRLHTSRIGYL